MARSLGSVTGIPRWPGLLVAGLVLFLTLGTVVAVASFGGASKGFDSADLAVIRFTVLQALVSAALSTLAAIPVARALARRQFSGRNLLITLLGAPFILPVIVAVLGLLAVFGRSGWVNAGLEALGLPTVSIYGVQGVILAHVFLNLPLATRLILQGWLSIPSERFRMAASLNAPVGRLLEWPMLRAVVPRIFVVIFLICLSSFAVALILGGPRATTIEFAIYQAVRFDFALGDAARLAMVQFSICAVVSGLVLLLTVPSNFGSGMDGIVQRWDQSRGTKVLDAMAIGLAALFLLLPLLAVIARGIGGLAELPPSIWSAVVRSVMVALASTALAISMALAVALRGGWALTITSVVPLAVSSLVMGTGLFVMVFPFLNPAKVSLPVTAIINAVVCLPFVIPALVSALRDVEQDFGRLSDQLGLTSWARLRVVILPRLRRPLGFSAGLAAALSMGDLGVIALFATPDQDTLPMAMYRLMGSYRTDAAWGAALVLLSLSLGMFWVFDRGGRTHVGA